MRTIMSAAVFVGWSASVLFLVSSGCSSKAEDCELSLRCEPGLGDPEGIIHVSGSGDDANRGTRKAPVKTLRHALSLTASGPRRVYVCAEVFQEAIEVPAGVQLVGGLDCMNGWVPSGTKTKLTAEQGHIPLRLLGGGEATRVERFDVTAKDGVAPGGSSTAVIVEDVAATIVDCSLTAQNGADGADGVMSGETMSSGAAGSQGSQACWTTGMVPELGGGVPGTNGCGNINPNGGIGGLAGWCAGTEDVGPERGADGLPVGSGGKGGDPVAMDPPYVGDGNPNSCPETSWGKPGKPGLLGKNGAGGRAGDDKVSAGTLAFGSGYQGVAGASGGDGSPGGGGGGGGGRWWTTKCDNFGTCQPGTSGGSGGAGGCGGKGGGGGAPGGSGIALISLAKAQSLTLLNTTLTVGNGGRGGTGAEGQVGAGGGAGAIAQWSNGCPGGAGGAGGNGGHGGGGSGGHSAGIAYAFKEPNIQGNSPVTLGTAGAGGIGAEGITETYGAAGSSSNVIQVSLELTTDANTPAP